MQWPRHREDSTLGHSAEGRSDSPRTGQGGPSAIVTHVGVSAHSEPGRVETVPRSGKEKAESQGDRLSQPCLLRMALASWNIPERPVEVQPPSGCPEPCLKFGRRETRRRTRHIPPRPGERGQDQGKGEGRGRAGGEGRTQTPGWGDADPWVGSSPGKPAGGQASTRVPPYRAGGSHCSPRRGHRADLELPADAQGPERGSASAFCPAGLSLRHPIILGARP